jgi:hypothetical protein
VALQDSVNTYLEENKKTGNELAWRLNFFKTYSEYQLQNILQSASDVVKESYIYLLVNHIIDTIVANSIDLGMLAYLGTTKESFESILATDIDKAFNRLFIDDFKEIDGITIDYIRPVLFNGSLSEEIIALGKKYSIDIPKRIRKRELIENIVYQFHLNHDEALKLSDELYEKPVVLIERFAKEHGIKINADLSKADMIEYFLVRHQNSKATYQKPQSDEVYHFTKAQQEALGVSEEFTLSTQTTTITPSTSSVTSVITTTTTTSNEGVKSYSDLLSRLAELEVKLKEEPKTVALEEKFASDPVKEAHRHRVLELLLLTIIAVTLILIVAGVLLVIYFTTTAKVDSSFKDGVDHVLNYVKVKGHGLSDLARTWLKETFGLGA